MAEILFIKTSSLGDVVHHMPAVADARRSLPDARLSWVVEEPYAALARLHPGIDEVIPVASRRWRAQLHRSETWSEIARFGRAIRERDYDAVIDSQGLLRTALITKAARGVRHGYDTASIREPLASLPMCATRWNGAAMPFRATACSPDARSAMSRRRNSNSGSIGPPSPAGRATIMRC